MGGDWRESGGRKKGLHGLLRSILSSVEGPNRRGRPLGRWEDKVKEYMSERGIRDKGGVYG